VAYDGSEWRKLQLLFGFGGIVEEALVDDNLDAGTNYLGGSVVPAGEIWVVQNFAIQYVGTAPSRMNVLAVGLGGTMVLFDDLNPVQSFWYTWAGTCILQEGDYLVVAVFDATAGDDLYLRYVGYRMEIE